MNHIYKSIFNKALGVFTAVPEFASAHGKGSERTVVGRVAKGTAGFAASALAISVGLALTSTSAVAAGAPGIYVNNGNDPACMTFIDDINVAPAQVIYGGSKRVILPDGFTPGTALSSATGFNLADRNPCVAVGGTAAENHDTQTNRTLFYNEKQLTLGGRLDVNSGIIGVGDRGTNGTGATNSIRMGTGTTLDDANKKTNAISIGVDSGVNTISSIAIGDGAKAGKPDKFSGDRAIAMGYHAQALGTAGIAIGEEASTTNGHNGLAIGSYAKTENVKAISIGAFSTASGVQSIVMASNYDMNSSGPVSVASGTRATVIGAETIVSGNNSVAIGDKNTVASDRTYAIGNNISVKAGINDALAFGTKASVQVAKSIAMGENATAGIDAVATHTFVRPSVAIGAETKATGKGSVSIGNEAASLGKSATALGIQATAPGNGQTSLGLHAGHSATGDQVKQQYGVFIGRYAGGDNQNPNVATVGGNAYGIAIGESAGRYGQGGNRNTAIGEQAGQYVKGSHNIALGTQAGTGTATENLEASETISIGHNSKASAAYSTAIGSEAKAKGIDSIAMGLGATVEDAAGFDGIAIGTRAKAKEKGMAVGAYSQADGVESGVFANAIGNKGSTASGRRASIIGVESTVSGNNSVAIGDTNTVASARTYAMGNNINVAAGADDSLAFGTRAAVGAANTVAIGANANAAQANSVALGAGSTTANVHEGDYTLNNSYTAAGLPNAANGTVSVGSKGKERQIQNVAAGVISATSTDAINGSQLYATNNYLTNFAGGVKNVLGGNAAVDDAGNVTMSNIGDTGKGTVHDAIKSLKDSINAKADTTASVTSENAADIKVEKEAPVGNITNYKLSLSDDAKAKLAKAETALQTVEGDSNITATKDPADPTKVKLALKRDLTADSVTLGNTAGDQAVVNKDGLTIDNGPSVKKDGINAGNKKITGVADGNVAPGSTDAVNGGQLAEVKSKADSAVQNVVSANPTALTVTKAGDTVTLTPNFIEGDLVNPATGEVNTPAADDAGKLVTAGTVAKALAETHFVVDTKATTGGELDGASQANQKIKSSNKVTLQAGKNLKAKQTNGTDGAQVEFSLKDSISLTQVTAGTGDNQVVLGKDGVQVGGNTYINKDGINAAGKAISNVANGNVAAYSKDAVNGGQLHDTAKSMADVIGGGATVKDGKVVAGQNGIGNTGQNTVHGAIAAINQNTANNFNQIRGDLRKMDRDLRGSIAGTLATAGLPQAFSPGKSMVAAAAGTYRGQSGLAVGVSRISDNGKVILKVTGNTNSRGDFGGTIGAGYQW